MDSNIAEGVEYAQPQTLEVRRQVARSCAEGLDLSLPTLLDDMSNTADRIFQGWPERIYALSPEGRVVYQGGKGPFGFDPEDLATVVEGLIAA